MKKTAQGFNEVYAVTFRTKVTANMSYLCLSKVVHETEETEMNDNQHTTIYTGKMLQT